MKRNHKNIELSINFITGLKSRVFVNIFVNKFEKVNGKSNIKIAGAVIEYFILVYLNGKKIKIDVVCGTSTTNNVFRLNIPDGIEYCIRNIKAIDKDSVKLYNESEDIERRR